MQHLLREPLVHFFALGALLFGLYTLANRTSPESPDEIVIDGARSASLAAQFERVWQRPPTREELDGLVEAYVREEIFYREGLALGLDQGDPVIRRRVGQKVSVLADAAADTEVSEAELEAWLAAHADEYRIEPRYDLAQVLFDPAGRGAALEADLAAARAALARGEPDGLGDASLLPRTLEAASASEVERAFGPEFAAALAALPVGGWHGPIRSAYGVHLVELRAREPGRTPALAEVRGEVERDVLRARAEEAAEAFYRRLRERYTVRIEAGEGG